MGLNQVLDTHSVVCSDQIWQRVIRRVRVPRLTCRSELFFFPHRINNELRREKSASVTPGVRSRHSHHSKAIASRRQKPGGFRSEEGSRGPRNEELSRGQLQGVGHMRMDTERGTVRTPTVGLSRCVASLNVHMKFGSVVGATQGVRLEEAAASVRRRPLWPNAPLEGYVMKDPFPRDLRVVLALLRRVARITFTRAALRLVHSHVTRMTCFESLCQEIQLRRIQPAVQLTKAPTELKAM